MRLSENFILDSDLYKYGHNEQMPENTTYEHRYFEARGGDYPTTVFFGLQYIIKKYLEVRITPEMVKQAQPVVEAAGLPFNYDGWMRIATVLEGRLPVRIRAVPEGRIVPIHNVLMAVESTDAETSWIVGWLETQMVRIWYPIAVATRSHYAKMIIQSHLDRTSENTEVEIPFKLHDFGSRGSTSRESAMIDGAAHLINFLGTDTTIAIPMLMDFYFGENVGFSIKAMEHSTVTSHEDETKAYLQFLQKSEKSPLIAIVAGKKGRLDLVRSHETGEYKTVQLRWGVDRYTTSAMRIVYENGSMLIEEDLATIRERVVNDAKTVPTIM